MANERIRKATGRAFLAKGASTLQRRLPRAVVATRPDNGTEWSVGVHRCAAHGHWQIRTADNNEKKEGHTVTVRFDSAIAPGVSLADPEHAGDRLTKQLVCVHALTAEPSARVGALGVGALAGRFDWLLRWRIDQKILSFSDLRESDLHEFLARLRTGGLLGLVNLSTRLDTWEAGARHNASPSLVIGKPLFKGENLGALAEQLGVTAAALWNSDLFRTELSHRLMLLVPSQQSDWLVFREEGLATRREAPSASMLAGYLSTWNWLWKVSRSGLLQQNQLMFEPFAESGVSSLASRFGTPNVRTPTIAPPSFFKILTAAAQWLLEKGPSVVEEMTASRPSMLPGAFGIKTGLEANREAILLGTRVRHVMAASAVLIGAFAGRRGGEVESAQAGSVSQTKPGVHWLSIYIEKTIQAADRVPVPALVTFSIQTLEALTAAFRVISGENWLFRAACPNTGRIFNFDLSRDLPAFATACGAYVGANALTQELASHQLRRGFGILFYHGFRLGSLEALSRQFRHFDLTSTQIYVSEADPGLMISFKDKLEADITGLFATFDQTTRDRLSTTIDRLVEVVATGQPLDAARCEASALVLLQAWQSEDRQSNWKGAFSTTGKRRVLETAAFGVRLGSQAQTSMKTDVSLLSLVRAFAESILEKETLK